MALVCCKVWNWTLTRRAVVADCLTRGVLINCTGEQVLRFVPPADHHAGRDRSLAGCALADFEQANNFIPLIIEARMSRRPTQRPRIERSR